MASQLDPIRIRRRDSDPPWVEAALPAEHEPLPHPLSSLIGREAEIAAIQAQLQGGARLLTILGPGGVGKTRLALAVAADLAAAYPDGVVFVSLAGIPQASLVLPALAARMGVRETLGRGLRDVLVSTLQGRHLLVVLDNLEHVLGAAPDIAHLLAACPRLAILATSRSPLRISGEQRFQTPPLGLPRADMPSDPDQLSGFPAVRLFTERAREVQSDFALTTDTSPVVADICRRLDGLPLAIELAAPWVRVLPLPALAAGLEQRLTMLHGGPEDQPARLRTMREAIAWSYTLLDEDQAQVFRRLSIFVDGLTLSAASAVGEWQSGQRVASDVATASHVAILDVLAALIDASLVQAMTDEGDEPRFRLLETVREYGLERLAAAGEAEDIAQAHAETMAAFVAAAEPNLLGPDEVRWQARCAAELGNLRAALSWAIDHDLEMALRMGGSLWAYWAWYQLAEGRRWLTLALSRDGKVAPGVRSRALTTQAALAVLEGDDSELEITQEALELARAAGDLSAEAVALWIRACGVMSGERISDAIPDLDAALQLRSFITSPTDRGWIAYARALRGAVEMILGDPDLGHVDYEAAIQEIREVGSPGLLIMFLGDYAGWLMEANDLPQARIYLTEAMALSARHRCLWQLCSPLVILAIVNAREGEIATAARQLGAIEEILKRSGLELSAHFAQRYERLADLVRLRLSRDDLEALRAEGRTDPIRVMADAGEAFISSAPSQAKRSTGPFALTPRERDVLRGLVRGASDKEIAAELGIGVRTVGTHVTAIRAKLSATSRSAAAAIAVHEHLV